MEVYLILRKGDDYYHRLLLAHTFSCILTQIPLKNLSREKLFLLVICLYYSLACVNMSKIV